MTIRLRRAIISSAAAVAAALALSCGVLAHGGETFFVAEPASVAPGGGVGVRADLLTSGPVRLTLAGTDGSRHEVGVVEQTEDGHFEAFIGIPRDLPTGHWTLLAQADGATLASATIEVAGTPVDAEVGGQGPRDEDDSLLMPLPSGWQASRSNPPTTTASVTSVNRTEAIDLVPIVSLAAAVGALTFLVLRTRGSGRRGGTDDLP
jgi:hypothetical protein